MTEQVTIFGANGNVGGELVAEAMRRGYRVVAFVHSSTTLTAGSQLTIVHGDIYHASDVGAALHGSDIVLSALGSWGTPNKDILTVGMRHIIDGMTRLGIDRIISLTGAEARATGDELGAIHRLTHLVLQLAAGKVLADGERHIALLEQSALDWTVVRSPVMSSKLPDEGTYSLSLRRPLPWQKVSRQFVVQAMIDAVHDRTWKRRSPYIAS
jgi:putative NADH-flavin reductase